MLLAENYEVRIEVVKVTISGGGLSNSSYVETSIDGEQIDSTPITNPPHEWKNHLIVKFLSDLEPVTPIILSFAVYKKRWTSHGFKLVGTVRFPLSDLFHTLNKGPFHYDYHLMSPKKNVTLSGKLSLRLKLSSQSSASPFESIDPPIAPNIGDNGSILNSAGFDNSILGWNVSMVIMLMSLLFLLLSNLRLNSLESSTNNMDQKITQVDLNLDKIMLKMLMLKDKL